MIGAELSLSIGILLFSILIYLVLKEKSKRNKLEQKIECLEEQIRSDAVVIAKKIKDQRSDAIKQSKNVIMGQTSEELAPLLPSFSYYGGDTRHLGSPIDFIVFNNLSNEPEEGEASPPPVEIVFIEVKTGKGKLSRREARVKDAVVNRRVKWEELKL